VCSQVIDVWPLMMYPSLQDTVAVCPRVVPLGYVAFPFSGVGSSQSDTKCEFQKNINV